MASIRFTGPDGHLFEFEEGTPDQVRRAFIQRHYGTSTEQRSGRANAARALSSGKRGAGERLGDVFSNTFNTSWIAEGWRAGINDVASVGNMTAEEQAAHFRNRAPSFELNPARLFAQLSGATLGIVDEVIGTDLLQSSNTGMIEAELDRKVEFARESAEDPFWQAEGGIVGKGIHGASALLGTLGGAALDPLSYATGGSSLLAKMGFQGAVGGGADILAQSSAVGVTQDEYSLGQTALSAAGGAAFMGLAEGAGRLFRKPGTALPNENQLSQAMRDELDVSDMISRPALSLDDMTARAVKPEAAPEINLPDRIVQPKSDGPEVDLNGKMDGPETKAEGTGSNADDPWNGVDWGVVGSPERVKAALGHLDRLKTFIKPDQVQTFVRWLGREGIDVADDASHWNREFFDFDTLMADPAKFEEVTNVMADIFRPLYDAAGDAPKTWAKTVERQTLFGITLSDAIKAHSDLTGEGGAAAKIHALETVAIQQTDALLGAIKRMEDDLAAGRKDAKVIADVAAHLQTASMLDAMAGGAKSEVARALNIMKMAKQRAKVNNDIQAQWDAMRQAMNAKDLTDDELAAALKKMRETYGEGGTGAVKDELRKMQKLGLTDYVSYYVVSGYLTTPATAMRNAIGSVMHATMTIGERYVAAGVTSPLRRTLGGSRTSAEGVTFREANAYVAGVHGAFTDAIRAGVTAFKTARPVTDIETSVGQAGRQMPFQYSAARRSDWANKGLLAIPDMAGVAIFGSLRTLGLRPSMAMDEFTKVMSRRMQLNALAVREASYRSARLKGKEADRVFAKTLDAVTNRPTAEAFARAEQAFKEVGEDYDPAKLYLGDTRLEEAADVLAAVDLQEMANDYARMMAFQKTGPTVEAFEKAFNRIKFMKALYVPFFRTPINLVRAGMVDRNPALAWATKENRAAFANYFNAIDGQEKALTRGGAEADLVMARMVTGIGFMSMASLLFCNGDITGKLTPAEEQDGKKSYSIRIGGRWFNYSQLSPVAEMLGLVADMHQTWAEKDVSDDALQAMAGGVLAAITNNIVKKAALQGIGDFFDLLNGPAPGASNQSLGQAAAKTGFKKIADAAVPAIVRNIAYDVDPTVREARDFLEAFAKNLPGLSQTVPEKRDWLGNPIVRQSGERGIFQAIRWTSESEDIVRREVSILAENDPELRIANKPPARFNGQKIDPAEHARVLEIQGQEIPHPATGMTMAEALDSLINSDDYAAMEDPQRAKTIKDVVTRYRRLGTNAIKRGLYPELREMVNRTGQEAAADYGAERGMTPEQITNRERAYGVTADDLAGIMAF